MTSGAQSSSSRKPAIVVLAAAAIVAALAGAPTVARADYIGSATTTSPKNGTIEWQGTIRNGVLEGTFVCKRLGGLIRRNYWIKATQK